MKIGRRIGIGIGNRVRVLKVRILVMVGTVISLLHIGDEDEDRRMELVSFFLSLVFCWRTLPGR